jgi:hypothetical protein
MEILVHRTKNTAKACTGTMDIDGLHECFTLEDPIRNLGEDGKGKIPGETGIPAGRYRVKMTWSVRFSRIMPLICDVSWFDGIRIHSGNSSADVRGCIAVGQEHINDDWIRGGKLEAPALYEKIQTAIDAGEEVWIDIVNEFPEEDVL